VNKPVTIKCFIGTYLSNEEQGGRFASQNRLLWEWLMILPTKTPEVYIIKSYRDGLNLGLTLKNRGAFTSNDETKPF